MSPKFMLTKKAKETLTELNSHSNKKNGKKREIQEQLVGHEKHKENVKCFIFSPLTILVSLFPHNDIFFCYILSHCCQ